MFQSFTGLVTDDSSPCCKTVAANTDAIFLIDNSCGLSKVECDAEIDIIWNMIFSIGSMENVARIGIAEYGDTTTSLVLYPLYMIYYKYTLM